MKKKMVFFSVILSFLLFTGYCNALPSNGLVAAFNFNGDAKDSSGHGNHGIVNGARLTTDRFGKPNSAYEFDGKSNIRISNSSSLNLNNLTISAWVKIFPGAPLGMGIVGKDGKNLSKQFRLSTKGNNSDKFIIDAADTKGGFQNVAGTTTPLRNQWYHIVQTYDGKVLRLYVNGVFESETLYNNEDKGIVRSFLPVRRQEEVDKKGMKSWFVGKIDDVYIYSRALTEKEITALYAAVPGAVSEPPVYLLFALGLFGLIYYKRRPASSPRKVLRQKRS
ncbi:MAG: LamG domain-containing protein [Nitrospinota bacterium]